MCLIAFSKDGKAKIPVTWMRHAHQRNNDGWGFMFAKDGNLIYWKENTFFKDFEEAFKLVPENVPVAVHFRFATHGDKTHEMCHPFLILNKAEHGMDLALMHNGGISIKSSKANDGRSDTKVFVDAYLRPMLVKDQTNTLIESKAFNLGLSMILGSPNKFLFMDSLGRDFWVNKHQGVIINDVWYSNTYSLPHDAKNTTTTSTVNSNRGRNRDFYEGKVWKNGQWVKEEEVNTNSTASNDDNKVIELKDNSKSSPTVEALTHKIPKGETEDTWDCFMAKSLGIVTVVREVEWPSGWIKDFKLDLVRLDPDEYKKRVKGMKDILLKRESKRKERAEARAATAGKGNPIVEAVKEASDVVAIKDLVTPGSSVKEKEEQKKAEYNMIINDLSSMTKSEIMQWVVDNTEDAAVYMVTHGHSGSVSSVIKYLNEHLDDGVDYIFNRSRKLIPFSSEERALG